MGIRTITPRGKLPLVSFGIWVKISVSFRVGEQPDNCSRGKLPQLGVRLWVKVSFGVGGNFPRGNCPRAVPLKLPDFRIIEAGLW